MAARKLINNVIITVYVRFLPASALSEEDFAATLQLSADRVLIALTTTIELHFKNAADSVECVRCIRRATFAVISTVRKNLITHFEQQNVHNRQRSEKTLLMCARSRQNRQNPASDVLHLKGHRIDQLTSFTRIHRT